MKHIIKTIMMAVACGGFFPAAATAQSYQLVTADNQLESGKRYLIVAQNESDYYAWNGLNTSDNKGEATTVSSPSDNIITPAATVIPVQLVQSNDEWKIIDTATEKYVGISSDNNTYLVGESAPISFSRFLWTISIANTGIATVKNFYNSSYHYLKFDAGDRFFRSYGNGEHTDITLYKETGSSLILYNGVDNSDAISTAAGGTRNVTLQNRTLYKDSNWNTLCLPFDLTISGSILDGDNVDVRTLSSSSFDNGTLTLNFTPASGEGSVTSITAGTPYIIKWTSGGNIVNPTFNGVTISSTAAATETSTSTYVDFVGTYSPALIYESRDKHNLYLGTGNDIYYPTRPDFTMKSCRAYFKLKNGLKAGTPSATVRAFVLNFGDGDASGIITTDFTNYTNNTDTWYTIDGRKLDGKPTQRGIYIRSTSNMHGKSNGQKVVIK